MIYNRLQGRQPARDRRDDPLRPAELRRAADRVRARPGRRPYNTRIHTGPAADADRQPGPRLDQGGREPGQGRPLLLRRQARDLRRARSSPPARRVRAGRGRLPAGARRSRAARRPTADRPDRGDAAPRRPRLPGLALALAGDAHRRARRARARPASGPTRRSRSRPRASPSSSASLPGDGFAGVNVTVPHKLAALAVADAASEAAPGDRRREHAQLRGRGAIAAENTDATGITRRDRRRRFAACGRWSSAPAARPGRRSGRCMSAGAEVDDLEPHRPPRPRPWPPSSGVERLATSDERLDIGPYDLVINATTVGLEQAATHAPTPADLKAHPVDADSISARTSGGGPGLWVPRDRPRRPSTSERGARDRRARGPGPPRSRLASDLDRHRAAAGDDAHGRARARIDRMATDKRPGHLQAGPRGG